MAAPRRVDPAAAVERRPAARATARQTTRGDSSPVLQLSRGKGFKISAQRHATTSGHRGVGDLHPVRARLEPILGSEENLPT